MGHPSAFAQDAAVNGDPEEGLRRPGFPPRRNGDDNAPGLADEGLPPDHRRDSLSAARPPEAPANLHLAGPRPRPALPFAAEVPGFLGMLAGRQAALGARRFGDPDQAGRVPPRLSHAAALARSLSSAAPGSGGGRQYWPAITRSTSGALGLQPALR